MTGGSHIHPDKYLAVAWADRPPPQSGLSARQVLQYPRLYVLYKQCTEVSEPSPCYFHDYAARLNFVPYVLY
jgi:hypothetical protein